VSPADDAQDLGRDTTLHPSIPITAGQGRGKVFSCRLVGLQGVYSSASFLNTSEPISLWCPCPGNFQKYLREQVTRRCLYGHTWPNGCTPGEAVDRLLLILLLVCLLCQLQLHCQGA
jgi:hypothetical protein